MPKTKPKRLRANETILGKLRDVEMRLRMEDVGFSMNKEENERIKALIRPWIESWVHEPIEIVIEMIEGKIDARGYREYV